MSTPAVLYRTRNEFGSGFAGELGRGWMAHALDPLEALKIWHEAHVALVRDDQPDLTARQTAILLTIYLTRPPHTVRGLAKAMNVTKPVITRALDTMGRMGLVSRRRDEADKRNVVIQRTVDGALYVERLGDLIVETAAGEPAE